MNVLSKLFKKKEKYPKWDIHQVEHYPTMVSLFNRIAPTTEFDNKDVYYYRGEAEKLKNLISNKSKDGEKAINNISLEFMSLKKSDVKNERVVFQDALFFSDGVNEIKHLNPYYSFLYRNEDNKIVPLKQAVIAKDAIYFCSK